MASWLSEAARSMGNIFSGKDVGWEELCAEAQRVGINHGGLPSCADASCGLANPYVSRIEPCRGSNPRVTQAAAIVC
jgi:hypothetical protein